jgi:hypothetical protein
MPPRKMNIQRTISGNTRSSLLPGRADGCAGGCIGCCKKGTAIVGWKSPDVAARVGGKGSGVALITSVGGATESRDGGRSFAAAGSNGADRTDPSIKQNVNVSSNVRLQVGQLFI